MLMIAFVACMLLPGTSLVADKCGKDCKRQSVDESRQVVNK